MIVFLDKDGVFEHHRAYMVNMLYDPIASAMLSGLFAKPGVQVVISASFRLVHTRESAIEHLAERGITCTLHDDWRTDRLPGPNDRVLEIYDWLTRHNETDYVVIDDEHCAPPLDPKRWVKCCPYNGMSVNNLLFIEEELLGLEHGVSQRAVAHRRQ